MPPPIPTCKAILLCQKTIVEEGTGVVSLIGIFDNYSIDGDGLTPAVEAFCQITSACGEYNLTVEIHDLQTGNKVATGEGGKIEIEDRLMRANVIIPIPRIPFQHAGLYDFVVLANGNEIDRQKFGVTKG